jgi:hypothetical protein
MEVDVAKNPVPLHRGGCCVEVVFEEAFSKNSPREEGISNPCAKECALRSSLTEGRAMLSSE